NGDLIANGTILGRHLKANEMITSPIINGGQIVGNAITGSTIAGTTISGGTIKAAHLEGATGSFSGTLTVNQLIGSNIIEIVQLKVNYAQSSRRRGGDTIRYSTYSRDIHIAAAPIERYFCILNSDYAEIIPAHQAKVIRFNRTFAGHERITGGIVHTSSGITMTVMLIATTSAKTIS
ncbi:hypothetical protein ACERCF_10230, partial [Mannheimia sp. E16BA]